MAKRLLVFTVTLLVAAISGTYIYSRIRTDRRLNSGEVVDDSAPVTVAQGAAPLSTPSRMDSSSDRRAGMENASASSQAQAYTTSSYAPAADSIAANPPNRATFAGTGKFQVYRQGDLTWRVNTDTGSTCILFATDEQWRKPIVYRNGCGGR